MQTFQKIFGGSFLMMGLLCLSLCFTCWLTGCLDTVSVKLPATNPVLAVDGWLTDETGPDTVSLYQTQTYFDNNPNPVVSGASLTLKSEDGLTENLNEVIPGKYLIREIRAKVGLTYTLSIHANGEDFTATTLIARISPRIDSILFLYKPKGIMFDTAGYYAYLYGQELPGAGDHVRIKVYRNGNLLNKPGNLDILDDQFTDGNYLSGFRVSQSSPFQKGDNVRVEMWSLSADSYGFFDDLGTQIRNGGLFSTTPVNVRTNVINTNPAGKPATGYFGGSLVTPYQGYVY